MAELVTPFLRDVPLEAAVEQWRQSREAAGCPRRVPAVRVRVADALRRVTAEPVWAARSSPPFDSSAMDGIAVRAADTVGAGETTPLRLPADAFTTVDTGDPLPDRSEGH